MDAKRKQDILKTAKKKLSQSITQIDSRLDSIRNLLELLISKMNTPHIYSNESADKSEKLLDEKKKQELEYQIEDLEVMKKNPYFAELELTFERKDTEFAKFGKFSLPQSHIYSWIAPIARMRFKHPGVNTFDSPDGNTKNVHLHSKSNYAIVNEEIKFFSYEDEHTPKTLILQEAIAQEDKGFRLKEIIVQMEEYQDSIIRLDPREPMLISGPAGSGKTTLALHRVAYLMQSPETEEYFPKKNALILLQDESTKKYFENLLPELGIKHFRSATYPEFLASILRIPSNIRKTFRFGNTRKEKDILEYFKHKTLIDLEEDSITSEAHFYTLYNIYKEYLPKKYFNIFKRQKSEKVLDRLDLNILAKVLLKVRKPEQQRSKKKYYYTNYELIVVDEAENYLKEELKIVKKSLLEGKRSVIYTGDLVQTSRAYALKRWDDIGEDFDNERGISLPRVYRTTKEILQFIKSLGYDIEIDEKLKSGPEVNSRITTSINEEISAIKNAKLEIKNSNSGILAPNLEYLEPFEQFQSKQCQVLTFEEAQGVEFDEVIIIGITENLFTDEAEYHGFSDVVEEQNEVMRNLLYVALTRARKRLTILSRVSLAKIIHNLQPTKDK